VSIQVSGRALGFTVVLAVLTGLIAGIVPALKLARGGVRESLATGVRGSGSMRRSRTQRGLVVAEVALAVILLAGAGLLVTSLARLQAVSPGFSADGVLVARLTLAGPAYQDRAAMVRFYDNVLNRLRGTRRRGTGAAGALPLSDREHEPPSPAGPWRLTGGPTSRWERVTPDYFRALGIPLSPGRGIQRP
jgi:putative ABC transport system permease protein